MKFAKAATLGILALGYASTANAAIIVDGAYDADYGAAKSTVFYDPQAPLGNFDLPGNTNHATGYSIYLKEQGGSVYGFLQAVTASGLNFANLYFDLDRANGNGSDLGFEVVNDRAFVPGVAGYSGPLGLQFAVSADGKGLEFRIPDAFFTGPIFGLNYDPGQQFALLVTKWFCFSRKASATLSLVAVAMATTDSVSLRSKIQPFPVPSLELAYLVS